MIALVYSSFQTLCNKHGEVVRNLTLNYKVTSLPRVCVNLRCPFWKIFGLLVVFFLNIQCLVLDKTYLFSARINPSTVLAILNNLSLIFLS